MTGVVVVILIILLAGGIAYVGDRVGHQVGRKRLTLFGLRPKYTSTIVAVGTGMLIALIVVAGALIASNLVRTAFFRLGTLSQRINELQAQSLKQEKDLNTTRNGTIAVRKYALIAQIAWTYDLGKTDASQVDGPNGLAAFFDQVVRIANQSLTVPALGLKPYAHNASEPDIRGELLKQLRQTRATAPDTSTKVLFLPVAPQNLFRGEVIQFAFQPFEDKRVAAAGETLASVDVAGGSSVVDFQGLVIRAGQTLLARLYPPQFLSVPLVNATQYQAALAQLPHLRGHYRLAVKAAIDLYPHTGPPQYDVVLEPAK